MKLEDLILPAAVIYAISKIKITSPDVNVSPPDISINVPTSTHVPTPPTTQNVVSSLPTPTVIPDVTTNTMEEHVSIVSRLETAPKLFQTDVYNPVGSDVIRGVEGELFLAAPPQSTEAELRAAGKWNALSLSKKASIEDEDRKKRSQWRTFQKEAIRAYSEHFLMSPAKITFF